MTTKTSTRTAGALALALVALMTTVGPAAAGPPGATGQSLLSIDVVVVGTPPAGTDVTVVHSRGAEGQTPMTIELDESGASPDIAAFAVTGIGHGVYVDPGNDGGADAIDYTCSVHAVGDDTLHPDTRCDRLAPDGVTSPVVYAYSQFWSPTEDEQSDVTVTLTFAPPPQCDGRDVTVEISEEEAPTSGPDVILGTSGADTIDGAGGNDVICGGGGNDVLKGGPGLDRILGHGGNDTLWGGTQGDRLFGGHGKDALVGQAGNDALDGGPLRDTCNGGTERDTGVACEVRAAIP
jgi:Ca2+-binding RTX toxin-like protein